MGILYSNLPVAFDGYEWHQPYTLPSSLNGLAWTVLSTPPTVPAPTGDGINEIAWCSGSSPPPTFNAFTSMLVDPTTGIIEECDVFFATSQVSVSAGNSPSVFNYPNGGPPAYGTPSGTSIIPHEIGHFFGIDHTNMHPGTTVGPYGFVTPTPFPAIPPAGQAPPSLLQFFSWWTYPLMTGAHWNTGAWQMPGYWVTASTAVLHTDEITAMSRLYPVAAPSQSASSPLRPLVNDFARFEGQVLTGSPFAMPQWGRNVYALKTVGGSLQTFAHNIAISGNHRLGRGSIVGQIDSTPPNKLQGTADFVLPYVPPDQEYVLRVEPLESLGFSPATGAGFAEWFFDPVLATQVLNALPASTTAANTLGSAKPFPSSLGSLFVRAGSVVRLNINESMGPAQTELVSRPVVAIMPRTGIPPGGGITITITVTVNSDYPLNLATATWIINGAPKAVVATPVITGVGPFVTVWTTTDTALGIAPGAVVRFQVTESAVPPPAIAVPGINECVF